MQSIPLPPDVTDNDVDEGEAATRTATAFKNRSGYRGIRQVRAIQDICVLLRTDLSAGVLAGVCCNNAEIELVNLGSS